MLNKPPTQKQEKEWLARITRYGCVATGETNDLELHHVLGRTAKQNKMHIGRIFVLPIAWRLHNPNSNDPLNVTRFKRAFTQAFGKQSALFLSMCADIREEDGQLPSIFDGFEEEILAAIRDTGA